MDVTSCILRCAAVGNTATSEPPSLPSEGVTG